MTNEKSIAAPAVAGATQKNLEFLFDYTKFHIGLYLTLTAAYITVATAKVVKIELQPEYFWAAVVAFMIAGLAGGVIASSITQTDARNSQEFLEKEIGPWDWKLIHFTARRWTWIEHTSFWIGLVSAVLSFRYAAVPTVGTDPRVAPMTECRNGASCPTKAPLR